MVKTIPFQLNAVQPPVNLTQKLGSVVLQIREFCKSECSVVSRSFCKFVQVTSFATCYESKEKIKDF